MSLKLCVELTFWGDAMAHDRSPDDSLTERLAAIGGQLQRLRWEALEQEAPELAENIAHAIDAVAWAAGIYSSTANIVDPPGAARTTGPQCSAPIAEVISPRKSNAAA